MTKPASVVVNDLLPAAFTQLGKNLKTELRRQGADDLPEFAWKAINSDAQEKVHEALNLNAFDLLAKGWCAARELAKYADPKLHPPTERSYVFLGQHTLTASAHPEIIVTVGSVHLPAIRLALELSANVLSVALSIQNGYILAVHNGDLWLSAQLKLGDANLHEPLESKRLHLPGQLTFDPPGLSIRRRN